MSSGPLRSDSSLAEAAELQDTFEMEANQNPIDFEQFNKI